MYEYTLIISQYYYSRHFFIVKHDENFIEKARAFAEELMNYKRDANNEKELYLGDLDPRYVGNEIRPRYNINDCGDIYFLQANYANKLMGESWQYKNDSRRERQGFQKKAVTESIDKHHCENKVFEIVKKHFEIA
ncbi:hypothetical protein J2T13_000822 [Paenibacillus sp. DS2015]|uniref:hypothetical protein n=1 Tax=Paenibacillus sp. DS2015 TaxID=3373917 RepID=UPI003D238430